MSLGCINECIFNDWAYKVSILLRVFRQVQVVFNYSVPAYDVFEVTVVFRTIFFQIFDKITVFILVESISLNIKFIYDLFY